MFFSLQIKIIHVFFVNHLILCNFAAVMIRARGTEVPLIFYSIQKDD